MVELLLGAAFGLALDLWSHELDRQEAENIGRLVRARADLQGKFTATDRLERLVAAAHQVMIEKYPELCRERAAGFNKLADPVFIDTVFNAVLLPPSEPQCVAARNEVLRRISDARVPTNDSDDLAKKFLPLLDDLVASNPALAQMRQHKLGAATLREIGSIHQRVIGIDQKLSLHTEQLSASTEQISITNEQLAAVLQKLDRSQREETETQALPARLPLLPTANEYFVGRRELIDALRVHFAPGGPPSRVALTGPGGIGKTQIAVAIVTLLKGSLPHVFWTRGGTLEQYTADLADVACSLGAQLGKPPSVAATSREIDRLTTATSPVLLVIDGPDDLALLNGCIPINCHLLITTRNARASSTNLRLTPVVVPPFSLQDAEEFLQHRLEGVEQGTNLVQHRRELIALLGALPLALEQAAAYMHIRNVSYPTYIERFKELRLAMLDKQAAVHGRLPVELDGHDTAKLSLDDWMNVATTWQLNFADLTKTHRDAAELMKGLALLSSASIPRAIAIELVSGPNPNKTRGLADNVSLDEALLALARYSLVRQVSSGSLSVHELVAMALRDSLATAELNSVWERTLVAFEAALPFAQEVSWREFNEFVPHGSALLSYQGAGGSERLDVAAEVLARLGSFFLEMEANETAAKCLAGSIEIFSQVNPIPWERVIVTTSNLGNAFRGGGFFEDAKWAFETALELLRKIQPTEGLGHAILYNQIGTVQASLGDGAAAMSTLERCVALSRQVNDSKHLPIHVHNLARQYVEVANYDRARELLQESRTLLEAQNASPPTIAKLLGSIALVEMAVGRFGEALNLEREALQILENYWPDGHPAVARHLNDFANALFSRGRYAEAIAACERSAKMREKHFGVAHHEAAQGRMNYGAMLVHVGQATKAIPHLEQAVAVYEATFGTDHPETAEALNAVGHALLSLGRTDKAVERLEAALKILDSHFPNGHRDSANVLHNLGGGYYRLGRINDALRTYKRCIEVSGQVMGPNHPHLSATFHNRGHMFLELGRLVEAEHDLLSALKIAEEGGQGADKMPALLHLGVLRVRQGRRGEGFALLDQAETLARQHFPPEHQAFKDIAVERARLAESRKGKKRSGFRHKPNPRRPA